MPSLSRCLRLPPPPSLLRSAEQLASSTTDRTVVALRYVKADGLLYRKVMKRTATTSKPFDPAAAHNGTQASRPASDAASMAESAPAAVDPASGAEQALQQARPAGRKLKAVLGRDDRMRVTDTTWRQWAPLSLPPTALLCSALLVPASSNTPL